MKFILLCFSLSVCLLNNINNSWAQSQRLRTLSIDSLFNIVNFKDSTIAEKSTHQAAKILDSLGTILNYSFVENFNNGNYSKTDYRLRGIVYETDRLDDKIYISQKLYFIRIDLFENTNNTLLSTKSALLKDYNVLQSKIDLNATLGWIIFNVLADLP